MRQIPRRSTLRPQYDGARGLLGAHVHADADAIAGVMIAGAYFLYFTGMLLMFYTA